MDNAEQLQNYLLRLPQTWGQGGLVLAATLRDLAAQGWDLSCELAVQGWDISQASGRLGARRLCQLLTALLLLLAHWTGRAPAETPSSCPLSRRVTRAQSFRLHCGQGRTLAAHRRRLAANIAAQRPASLHWALPLPRASYAPAC